MKTRAIALVPAAGVGSRMSASVHKAFVSFQGKPLLWHCLEQLNQVPEIEAMVIALHADDFDHWENNQDLMAAKKNWKPVYAVTGGESRTHSVREAFKKALTLCAEPFYACVHDAARPYATTQMIQAVIQAASTSGAAGCALDVVDTIKEQDESGTLRTLNRASLKAIQTPQVIRSDLFSKGYDNWANGNFQNCTDDLQLIESLSVKIALLKGDPKNIKITYQNDI